MVGEVEKKIEEGVGKDGDEKEGVVGVVEGEGGCEAV